MINDFRFILCTNTCQKFLFGFRNSKFIKSIFDIVWNIIPILFSFIRCFSIIVNILEINNTKISTPSWHWFFHKDFIRSNSEIKHPLWLIFHFTNFNYSFFRKSFFTKVNVHFCRVFKIIFCIINVNIFCCHDMITPLYYKYMRKNRQS